MTKKRRQFRAPKTIAQKLGDLDDHMFLLRNAIRGLRNKEISHLKVIAAELRTLACFSSDTEGLLWRLVEELEVSDEVDLCEGGSINRDHPLAQGLQFFGGRNFRAEHGPRWIPRTRESLKHVIKTWEALYVPTIANTAITHEYLIKAVAQQMGSAHEDDGVELILSQLLKLTHGKPDAFAGVLLFDTDLVLQVGERALDAAVSRGMYQRRKRQPPHGDLTIAVRLGLREAPAARVPFVTVRSLVSEVVFKLSLGPATIGFTVEKRGMSKMDLDIKYPDANDDFVIAFSYSSSSHQARLLVNDEMRRPQFDCDLGSIDSMEVEWVDFTQQAQRLLRHWGFLHYSRLLSRRDCRELLGTPFEDLPSVLTPQCDSGGFPE